MTNKFEAEKFNFASLKKLKKVPLKKKTFLEMCILLNGGAIAPIKRLQTQTQTQVLLSKDISHN